MAHSSGQRRATEIFLTQFLICLSVSGALAGPTPVRHGEAVAQVYAEREQRAAWVAGPVLTRQARGLMGLIAAVGADGLDPEAYHLSTLHGLQALADPDGEPAWADAAAALRAESLLTDAFLTLGRDLARGRLDPEGLWDKWQPAAQRADPLPRLLTVLSGLPAAAPDAGTAAADTMAAALVACRPTQAEYQALQQALGRLADITAAGGWPAVEAGPVLHVGDRDARVPQLRARLLAVGVLTDPIPILGAPWHLAGDRLRYDAALVRAVRTFQLHHGLTADGVIGVQTLAALNVTSAARAIQVTLNLERWRWLPEDLGPRHIRVNIPDFSLSVVSAGVPELTMRAIVGRPDRPTPVLSGVMGWLVLNPSWTVPQKLAREDLLPKVAADPGYLAERGFRVFADWRPGASEIDPASVDWSAVVPADMAYKFRQEPGPRNALGRIKFLFPNDFSVYIHDTDQRGAFAGEQRCFSSGCVRVENPRGLLAALATPTSGRIDSTFTAALEAGETTSIGLPAPLPVHLLYLTAWVDVHGVLQFREDCYGYDRELAAALATREPAPQPAPPVELPLVAWSANPVPADPGPVHQVRTGPVSTWTNPGPE